MQTVVLLFAAIVVIVNITTEVVKNTFNFKSNLKINLFVILISEVLSLIFYPLFFTYKSIEISAGIWAAIVVAGVLAAYAAMFGFDKLIKQFEDIFEDLITTLQQIEEEEEKR